MNRKLTEALDEIRDKNIEEAEKPRKRRFYLIGTIAAILALAVAWTAIWGDLGLPNPNRPTVQGGEHTPVTPGTLQSPHTLQLANLAATPVYPVMEKAPKQEDYGDSDYYDAYFRWEQQRRQYYNQHRGYADNLDRFFKQSIPQFLNGEENSTYSPLNVYLALAMLAETTAGESRDQLLELLGADSIEALQTQAGHVWNAHYCDDGETTSLLANSLWLDDAFPFEKNTVNTLSDSYYASVFHGDLGTKTMDEQLHAWLNAQTGGLLEEQVNGLEMDPATVFALASTAYFSAGWENGFSESKTTEDVFHCKDFDLNTQFMHDTIAFGTYYWGKDFGAVRLPLSGNNTMWLILPDEGKTVDEVLAGGEYWQMTQTPSDWKSQREMTVNLSLPKFDISSQTDLISGMKELGVTDIFDRHIADFTPLTPTNDLYVGKIDHAARVSIDEEGVTGAAYTVIMVEAGCAPSLPAKEIDFTLDRPFMFMVTRQYSLPMFTGVVAQP